MKLCCCPYCGADPALIKQIEPTKIKNQSPLVWTVRCETCGATSASFRKKAHTVYAHNLLSTLCHEKIKYSLNDFFSERDAGRIWKGIYKQAAYIERESLKVENT